MRAARLQTAAGTLQHLCWARALPRFYTSLLPICNLLSPG